MTRPRTLFPAHPTLVRQDCKALGRCVWGSGESGGSKDGRSQLCYVVCGVQPRWQDRCFRLVGQDVTRHHISSYIIQEHCLASLVTYVVYPLYICFLLLESVAIYVQTQVIVSLFVETDCIEAAFVVTLSIEPVFIETVLIVIDWIGSFHWCGKLGDDICHLN